jgi:hypothetical protein
MKNAFSRVFTLEDDGRPTLAFEASRARAAQEICKESWLRGDLVLLRSDGAEVCTAQSKLSVRSVTDEEAIVFRQVAEVSQPNMRQ